VIKFFATEVDTGTILARVSEDTPAADEQGCFWLAMEFTRALVAIRDSEAVLWRQIQRGPPEQVAWVKGTSDVWIAEDYVTEGGENGSESDS
jgi:hypothetical protein